MGRVVFRLNETDAAVSRLVNALSNGDPVVTETGGLGQIGLMQKGDTLDVMGHGSPTTLGRKTAQELAALLVGADMPSGIDIGLWACNCGTGGAPYALELKRQLVNLKNLPASVSALSGTLKRNRATGAMRVTDKTGNTITSGTETVNTPWGPRTRNVSPTFTT